MPSSKSKAAPAAPCFLGEAGKSPKPADAFFHLLPIPYTGERNKASSMADAPAAIIAASQHLETWDGRSIPAKHGIHTLDPIDCKGGAEKVLARISAVTAEIVKADKFPIGLGGDGAVSYALVKGLIDAGIEDFGVVQIDAHADLRDDDGGDPWSEACVMKRIVDEDVPLFQLGVRSLSKEESDARKVYGVKFYDADFLVSRHVNKVEMPGEFPEKVYLSIDIDGFDPSVFPTASGMPGGLGWWQVLSIVESISQQCDIIGLDLTEFCPEPDHPRYDQAAAQLLYRLMGIVERARL
ncbi:MAG: arginase family protein [Pseudomonadales bacterium]|jgi:agmatinase|nr:arginase family protein [Pseudomonadales bacterium]